MKQNKADQISGSATGLKKQTKQQKSLWKPEPEEKLIKLKQSNIQTAIG